MIGIIYLNSTKQIISIVPDVQDVTNTDITGKDASAKGIDLAQASFCIVESTTLQVGDTLGEFTDTRHLLPKTEVELMKEENQQLNNQIIDLWETLLNAGVL